MIGAAEIRPGLIKPNARLDSAVTLGATRRQAHPTHRKLMFLIYFPTALHPFGIPQSRYCTSSRQHELVQAAVSPLSTDAEHGLTLKVGECRRDAGA